MATTGYDDRILLVEVSGLRQQDAMPTSHYTFKVPYRSLARTLQFIRHSGGTVVRVQSLSLSLPIQPPFQTSMPLEASKVELSPAPEVDLEGSLPSEGIPEGIPETAESTQPTVEAAMEEPPSPQSVETEAPKASEPPGLVSLLVGKLKSMGWVQHSE